MNEINIEIGITIEMAAPVPITNPIAICEAFRHTTRRENKVTLWFERILKQALLTIAVLFFTTAIALAHDDRYRAVRFRELVIIDPKVFYHEKIIDKLPQNARVVFLNGDTPGTEQLTRILAREKDLRVLRLITHGGPGRVVLNGEVLDKKALARRRELFRSWANAFGPNADILLYGCSVAQNEAGEAFVHELSRLTGADVAASTDITGGDGGNWDLEFCVGSIESAQLDIDGYEYHLANQTVTLNTDAHSGTGGEEGELRYAIANVGEEEEITFNLGAGNETITLQAQLTISQSMTIDGENDTGSGTDVTIQANALPNTATYRVFQITTGTVTLENMTIKNGGGSGAGGGGGIYNENATLTMNNLTVSGNTTSRYGGGIRNENATLTMNNSTVSGNTTRNYGGGISNKDATLTMNNSTISGNTAELGDGGGIHNGFLSTPIASLANCTISGNTAGGDGGGLYQFGGTLNVRNTIIANSSADSGEDYYYHDGTLTDNGYNVVRIQDGTSNQFSGPTDWLWSSANSRYEKGGSSTTDYGLLYLSSSLADNGGPTETLAITSASSIAVANGNTSETTDQRGATRKSPPTIGAYEYFADYRTDSGADTSWITASNWEIFNGISWADAATAPYADNSTAIHVRRNMNVNTNVSIDQATVDAGATLTIDETYILTVENGAGDDLTLQGDLNNAGTTSTFTCAAGATVVCSGASNTTLSGAGTWTFKTLTLNKDAAATLNINTDSNVTVETALTVTQGTVDLDTWEHDLRLGGALTIDANGRWTAHGNTSTHCVQFYGADCTFTDNNSGSLQNLGHVKVDD